jgi:hypothetical protein
MVWRFLNSLRYCTNNCVLLLMKNTKLLKIESNGAIEVLDRIPLKKEATGSSYDEAYIEKLIFDHPEILPIGEIDTAYINPVPICTQLSTKAGTLDILLLTPAGRIVIIEAKLWRNPEAKRTVVAQILDYAAELSRWTYEDLEREVSRRRGSKTSLFKLVSDNSELLDEADFFDELSRSLRLGRFLLLVCGDGIREGLGNISEFLENYTTLDFTFGLVELAIYADRAGTRFIDPRVIARSLTIKRQVIHIEGEVGRIETEAETATADEREWTEREKLLFDFWSSLVSHITFDDPSQPTIKPSRLGNVFLKLPSPQAWITLYFHKQADEQGIFLTFYRGEIGDLFYSRLLDCKASVEEDLGIAPQWKSDNGKHMILLKRKHPDIETTTGRTTSMKWFQQHANAYVNTFRPRIAAYNSEI